MFNTFTANISKLIDDKLEKFKIQYKQYLAKTGINKQEHINDADGSLASATTTINSIIDALEANGITKKS
jgi:hypothetical protein